MALIAGLILSVPPWDHAVASDPGPGVAPSATFSPNILVDDGSGTSWSPTIAVDGGGKLHLAWSDDRGGFRRLYYSNSTDTGTTWSPDLEIDGAAGTVNSYDPSVAADDSGGLYNGSVYVAWRQSTGADADTYIRRSPDRGASWLAITRVDGAPPGISSGAPVVTVGPGGVVFVAYADTRNASHLEVFVRRSFDGGATWDAETQISQTAANNVLPVIAARGADVYLAWRELAPTTFVVTLWVSHTADGGATWTNTIVDSGPTPTDRLAPHIFVAPDGTVHLIWIGSDLTGIPTIRASRSTNRGVSWSAPQRVDDGVTGSIAYRTPRLGMAGGDLYAIWADNRNGDRDIFYTTSPDNGLTWGDGIAGNDGRVDDTDTNANASDDGSDQMDPAIATDGFGVYVAWSDARSYPGASKYDLYFSRFLSRRVLITEFADAPQGSEAVELAAYGGSPISLAGYRLQIGAFSLDLSPLGVMSSGQHRVVGDPAWADLVFDISVPDEGGTISVFDGAGVLIDSIAYGQRGSVPDPIAGESVSRHWSGAKYTDDWARTPIPSWRGLNAVPANNLSPPVVLNEVLFNPATPTDAFIELFFSGIGPMDLNGYTIAADEVYSIPSGTVSAGDPFFVLKQADDPALFAGMGAGGDNVYLYDSAGALLDMAGWSSLHGVGSSMARVPEGLGGHSGFDDGSSVSNGWRFDQPPTVPLVVLRQSQQAFGDLGQSVVFHLTVTQKEGAADYIDLTYTQGADHWNVALVDVSTGALLQDHDGDSIPDTGRISPGIVFDFNARVDIPGTPPVANMETVTVTATASLTPLARSSVTLEAGTYPRIEPSGSVDPNPIHVIGSPPTYVTETNLTLTIAGRGSVRVRRAPQDVVLLMDRSGSLDDAFCPGCFGLMKEAAKSYVNNLTIPDTGTVIYFTDVLLPKGPLTTNYAQIRAWIDSETTPFGGTQIGEAIHAANDEIAARGTPMHFWAIILLTDGVDNPGGLDPITEARGSASLGIRVFTIGLGPSVDELLLRNIAAITGGEYLHANTAADLFGIYEKIGTLVDNLAGYDADLTDDIPMVSVTLPPYIVLPVKPFVDPVTGSPRPPDFRTVTPAGTELQWNVSVLRVNQTWSVRFAIQSVRTGIVDAISVPASRANYQRWDGATVTMPFPRIPVTVLGTSTVRYTITRSPATGVVYVDGQSYGVPAIFDWSPGARHDLEAIAADPFGPDSRYLLGGWDDGGAAEHTITVGTVDATVTAAYFVQHRPTVLLLGTSAAHDVEVRFTAAGVPSALRGSGTWSDWVDEGTRLSADALAGGSGADERWATEEDFSVAPWSAVAAPFSRSVLYIHQYALRLVTVGLSPAWPAIVTMSAFGRAGSVPVSDAWNGWIDEATEAAIDGTVSVSAAERYRTQDTARWRGDAPLWVTVRYYRQWLWRVALVGLPGPGVVQLDRTAFGTRLKSEATDRWSEWLDHGTTLSVDDAYSPGARERYRARDPTSWAVTAAGDVTVAYVHEMRPAVLLVGTDEAHTVGVRIGDRRIEGLHGSWTDWVEVGATLRFDRTTTGLAPLFTSDPTDFQVTTPFDSTIAYAAPLEVNLKPFFSAAFVAILVGVGSAVAYRRPVRFAGSRRPNEVGLDSTVKRVKRDRWKTALLAIVPVAAVEGSIGIASFFTGILRIPEGGSWLTLGLVVNTALTVAGLVGQWVARHRGYRAKRELDRAEREAALRAAPPPPPDGQ